MSLEPGIYPATTVPMASYLADPCPVPSLSSGAAHRILTRSPLHVYASHPRLGGRMADDSAASDMGSLAHDLLLGGEGKICVIDPQEYRSKPTKDNPDGSVPTGWTNNAIRAARDEARANGLLPVLPWDISEAKLMVKAAHEFVARSEIAGAFDSGASEQTLLWIEDGTWFRARPDWLNTERKIMVHYKTTTASANPEPFIRGIMDSGGYDVALAFYRRGLEALAGGPQDDWLHVILAQEQLPPHACSLISLDPAKWQIAVEKVDRAVSLWRECMRSGKWPAYSSRIHYASPTAWQLAEAEQRLLGQQE